MGRRKTPDLSQPLGPRQDSLMKHLWAAGAQTPVELHRAIAKHEDIAYTTIFTELSRMVAKGLIRKRGSEHKSVVYEPVFSREEFVAKTVSNVLGNLLESHGAAAIHGFVDLVADADVMAQLDAAIALRKGRGKRR